MAWLAATPKPPEGSKRAATPERALRFSRLEQMKKDGITPSMPPNPAPHIIGWLVEIGIAEANGMAQTPISWREIDAWCSRTRIDLAPWEARLLRRLSVAYLAEGKRAESENCAPPWSGGVSRREIETEEARLRAVLG